MKKLGFIACIVTLLVLNSCKRDIRKSGIIFSGSDTEKELVDFATDEYSKQHPFKYKVSGGGTSQGIEDLLAGKSDVLNASRILTGEEWELFESEGFELKEYVVAVDAIGIITHPSLGVDSISTIQLQGILAGTINNWSELGGPNRKITLYGRNKKSGTFQFMKRRFVDDHSFRKDVIEMASNRSIIAAVRKDKGGVGYVGSRFIVDEEGMPSTAVWALNIYVEGSPAYSPYQASSVMNGEYALVRPLLQYTNKIPKGDLKNYFNFVLSVDGQAKIRKLGYFSITSEYTERNKQNGLDVTSEILSR